jgi:hypothetical protein
MHSRHEGGYGMKFVETGVGDDGRSRVTSVHDVLADRAFRSGSLTSEVLWATNEIPFELPIPRRAASDPVVDFGIPANAIRFTMLRIEAGEQEHGLHRTDTIDFDLVVAGEVDLLLDDGDINLQPGDSVVLPGVTHGWRAGPDGVVMCIAVLGLAAVQ